MLKKFLIILFILVFNLPVFAEDKIHVAFCIDNNYPIYTMLAINSILLNNTSNSKYHFHIVENNVSKFNKFQMEHFVKNRGADIEFIPIDIKKIDGGKNIFEKNSYAQHVTRIGIARIILPELLPNLDKILYLDGDILVTGDLKTLWNIDLGQYHVGMVKDVLAGQKTSFNSFDENYYNSGMILMNAKLWRKDNISNIFIDYIKNIDSKNLMFPDQDIINKILKGKIKELDKKYNYQVVAIYSPIFRKNEEDLDKIIIHYITKNKPWLFLFSLDYYTRLYLDYWNKSYLIIYSPLHFLNYFNSAKQRYAIEFNNKLYCSYQGYCSNNLKYIPCH